MWRLDGSGTPWHCLPGQDGWFGVPGLAWLGENRIGLFALHTTAAAVCGIHLGPWLLSRWSIWVLPLFGITLPLTGSDHLQHFELVSLAPAVAVGDFIYPRFPRLATWA